MSTAVESALTQLRTMIVNGDLPLHDRITESSAAALIGLSRTPVRTALSQLESEGLLVKLEGRGYRIRPYSFADLEKAAEVRGALEGIAAGRLALQGPDADTVASIEQSIAMTEAIIRRDAVTKREVAIYQEANDIYHRAIVGACGNEFVGFGLERITNIPIIAPGAFAEVEGMAQAEMLRMTVGHSQHVIIWDAINARDPVRAENMMREHAGAPVRYAKLFIGDGYQRKLFASGIIAGKDETPEG
ncbi:GntR family transcriptional regulator [Microbulbifer sp. S227A]|uniref:GntR family transcriptional regulator n=1 Tax=Microbulbifer sp. S227A TaxID=3415131 RepID=UPI003C7CE512